MLTCGDVWYQEVTDLLFGRADTILEVEIERSSQALDMRASFSSQPSGHTRALISLALDIRASHLKASYANRLRPHTLVVDMRGSLLSQR
jgi:hypothetical protein